MEGSAVSLFCEWNLIDSMGAAARRSWDGKVKLLMQAFPAPYSGATLILHPIMASNLKEYEGFNASIDVGRRISENVKRAASQFYDNDMIYMLIASPAMSGVPPYAAWKQLPRGRRGRAGQQMAGWEKRGI